MKSLKTIAIMAVFLMLVLSSLIPATIATSEQRKIAQPMPNSKTGNDGDHAEIYLADMDFIVIHMPPVFRVHGAFIHIRCESVYISPNAVVDVVVGTQVDDRRIVRLNSYNVSFELTLSRGGDEEVIKKSKQVNVPEGIGKFYDEGGFVLTFAAPSKPGIYEYPYTLKVKASPIHMPAGWSQKIVQRRLIVEVGTCKKDSTSTSIATSKSQPVTKPNIQPTPSITTNPTVTNPVISKLFETISNQINSYNSNVETTPSITPNAQPNPSTTPAEEVQAEPSDASNIVNEEQETVNC